MLKKTIRALEVLILFIVVVGFLVLFIIAITQTWQAAQLSGKARKPPELPDTFLYVATSIAGFMTAFFANKMGVEITRTRLKQKVDDEQNRNLTCCQKVKAWFNKVLDGNHQQTKIFIGSIYLILYFVVSLVAIITWVGVPDVTPPLVKNVASISVALFLGIVKGVLDTIEDT